MSDNNDFDFDDFSDFGEFEEFAEDDGDGDILESYDDDSEALSPEEITRKIDNFQKDTRKYSSMAVKAKSFTKSQRVEAIRWLGESGNPQAIKALLRVYKKDKTPGMKEEAAYALGQFKAYQHDQEDPETMDIALQRIDDIILYDKRGKRTNPLPFIIGEIALVALAVVLVIFGGILAQQNAAERAEFVSQTQTAMPTPTMDTENAVRNDIESFFTGMFIDVDFYKQQLLAATRGEGINCNLDVLYSEDNYTLTEQWQSNQIYADTVTALNSANDILAPIETAYRQACANGVAPAREDALQLSGDLIEVERQVVAIRDALAIAGIQIDPVILPTATPPPAATLDPAVPTPTQDLTAFNGAITALRTIIANMTETRGATTVMQFNWEQVITSGTMYRSGCNQPRPIIPQNYTLDESISGQYALLDSAVSNINIALDATRASEDAFFTACEPNEVPEDALGRQAQVNLAISAFESATIDLDNLQGQ